jgi:hypothetical protein
MQASSHLNAAEAEQRMLTATEGILAPRGRLRALAVKPAAVAA